MLIGYARVSTDDQNLDLQRAALNEVGCTRIYKEKLSGASRRGRVDYGLEGDVPAASHWFFRSDSTTVRSGFRMRHGPAQVSWPRLCPQRYTGGTPRAGRPHNPC